HDWQQSAIAPARNPATSTYHRAQASSGPASDHHRATAHFWRETTRTTTTKSRRSVQLDCRPRRCRPRRRPKQHTTGSDRWSKRVPSVSQFWLVTTAKGEIVTRGRAFITHTAKPLIWKKGQTTMHRRQQP